LIWVTRDDNQGLVTGRDPVFRPGQLFGFLIISTAPGDARRVSGIKAADAT
jgi:hypothetical protein